jgi:dipeptidyl aminopeptidase/acylaminoacyl peptidase
MAALQPTDTSSVQGIAAFYAPSDLVDLVQKSDRIPEGIRKAVKGTPLEALFMAGLKQISPRFFLKADAPPMLLMHGTGDTLVPYQQSQVLCADARAAGASCQLYIVDGGAHGVRYWESKSEYKSELTMWLATVLD